MITIDGVSKVFIVRHDGHSMHFEGYSSFEDAAIQLLFTDSWKPGWEDRLDKFKVALERRVAQHLHEHVFDVDVVEGDEVVGKACACGALREE